MRKKKQNKPRYYYVYPDFNEEQKQKVVEMVMTRGMTQTKVAGALRTTLATVRRILQESPDYRTGKRGCKGPANRILTLRKADLVQRLVREGFPSNRIAAALEMTESRVGQLNGIDVRQGLNAWGLEEVPDPFEIDRATLGAAPPDPSAEYLLDGRTAK